MHTPDTREWLLTNGLGSFASGTICDARTRTYHGWLIAALDPPQQRTLLLSHLDASLEIDGQVFALGTNFWAGGTIEPHGYEWLQHFDLEPVPTWVWSLEQADRCWQLTRQIMMPYGLTEPEVPTDDILGNAAVQIVNRVFIHYTYTGSDAAILRLRPIVGDRSFHHQQQAEPDLDFAQLVVTQQLLLQANHAGQVGTPWQLRWTHGFYKPDKVWYRNYHYPEEKLRGLYDYEDLFSPGYLSTVLQPGESLTLEARTGWTDPNAPPLSSFDRVVQAKQQRLARCSVPFAPKTQSAPILTHRRLLNAVDQFITYRTATASPAVIAGYPWFNERVRDTLIALPGLTLVTQRFSLARQLLESLGRYCQQGLLPGTFMDDGRPLYNSLDASLWWIETLGLYLEASQDWEFVTEQYPIVKQIYKAFAAGTFYNVRVDASDGLVIWDDPTMALTWMDACVEGRPVTPRLGKPIEVNALWYSALCWASQWAKRLEAESATPNPVSLSNQVRRYTQQTEQVKSSLQKFWNGDVGYLYDVIEPDDRVDARIRPNAVLAISLSHCAFTQHQGRQILQIAHDRLLTPYGLRSLDPADRGYIGQYEGNPRQRDLAYHQGTVWSWLIGSFIRAWERFYDVSETEPLPFDWQPLLDHFNQQGCLGGFSEIFDGNFPHAPKGAIAQASTVAEVLRHWLGKGVIF